MRRRPWVIYAWSLGPTSKSRQASQFVGPLPKKTHTHTHNTTSQNTPQQKI